jgi:hypothetical protein
MLLNSCTSQTTNFAKLLRSFPVHMSKMPTPRRAQKNGFIRLSSRESIVRRHILANDQFSMILTLKFCYFFEDFRFPRCEWLLTSWSFFVQQSIQICLKDWIEKCLISFFFHVLTDGGAKNEYYLRESYFECLKAQSESASVMPPLVMSHGFCDTTIIGKYGICQPLKSREESYIR